MESIAIWRCIRADIALLFQLAPCSSKGKAPSGWPYYSVGSAHSTAERRYSGSFPSTNSRWPKTCAR